MAGQSRKWMILVATIWIQAFTGTNFDFSAYSSVMKAVLGVSQVELSYLATASDLGKVLGWSSCVALIYLPLWVVMFMAAFMGLVGYGLQWLVIENVISLPYFVEDFLHMYSRSVWYIKGIPMRILKWTQKFHVDRELPLDPVWIRFPRLPIHYFERSTIFAITGLIGAPLCIDSAMTSLKRPIIARVQVELDMLKERPDQVWISVEREQGFWQKITYESIPAYC